MGGSCSRSRKSSGDKAVRPLPTPLKTMAAASSSVPPELAAGQLRLGVQVRQAYRIGNSRAFLVVAAGSVCDFEGDAIVNAANEGCITGGGVDGEVTRRGGEELAQARKALPVLEGTRAVRCPTGEARITIGGRLKNPYCIHAVGPNYNVQLMTGKCSMEDCDALLVSAYRNSMVCAKEKALKSVGFALLSAAIFRGPQSLEKVLAAGVQGILEGSYPELEEVHMCAFTRQEQAELEDVCAAMFQEGAFETIPQQCGQAPSEPVGVETMQTAQPGDDAEVRFTNEPPPEAAAIANSSNTGPSLPSGGNASAPTQAMEESASPATPPPNDK